MKKLLLLMIFVLPVRIISGAGFDWNEACRNAYQAMWTLDFSSVHLQLIQEKKNNPANPVIPYIEHYSDFLKAFITEEEMDFLQLKNNLDKRLSVIDKSDDATGWKDMARGEMLLQLAVVKLKRKEFLSAGYYIRRSYKILEENQTRYPGFIPNQKSLGFFHSIIGSVPENYKWLSNLAGFKGSISQGGRELSNLVNNIESNETYRFLTLESIFIKIFIATHFEKDFSSATTLLDKAKKISPPGNPMMVFMEANTLLASGKPGEALNALNGCTVNPVYQKICYLDYMTGSLKLNNLNFESRKDFDRFLSGFKGRSFIKSANLKLAWISLLENDINGFRHFLKQAIQYGDDFTDEDKQALKAAQSEDVPNKYLLRARLLCDGGNYNDALGELAGKPTGYFSTYHDQLEYTYRLARIFDKKGQHEKAIQYYTQTYENGMRTTWYFAANAALNNGILYESGGDRQKAMEWYKKCLALRNHDYQNSIDQKAEAGLNRLSNGK